MSTTARRPFYLDCDTGIDDSLAIAFLYSRPDIELRGIGTVSGNTSAAQGARNSLDLIALLGDRSTPVAVGAHDFLETGFHGGAPHVHGDNGIGGVTLPPSGREPVAQDAAELLLSLARQHAGELELLAVGPLTNLALALRRDPELPALVKRVTIMGGAALAPGNVTPAAEANIWGDPEAAAAVFAASWPLTVVGLDVTMAHRIGEPERQRLLEGGPAARAIGAMLDHYYDFYAEGVLPSRGAVLHDPLAAAIATGAVTPELAPVVPAEVDTTDGPDRGRTLFDLRGRYRGYPEVAGAHVSVVLQADAPFASMLVEAVRAL